jgi:hypothetical protein
MEHQKLWRRITRASDFDAVLRGTTLILVWGASVSQLCPHPKFETRQNLANYIDFIEI